MKEKKYSHVGRRTGLIIGNQVRKKSDGTENYDDYFESDDDTSSTETSELQDTTRSYKINYTGVSLESETTSDTSECTLIHQKPLKTLPRKSLENLGKKKALRRKTLQRNTSRKLFLSQIETPAPFSSLSESYSESSSEKRTFVDKSVVTSPASFTRASLATSTIGLNRLEADSPNVMLRIITPPSMSRSRGAELLGNISVCSIGLRGPESSETRRSINSLTPSRKSVSFKTSEEKQSSSISHRKSQDLPHQKDTSYQDPIISQHAPRHSPSVRYAGPERTLIPTANNNGNFKSPKPHKNSFESSYQHHMDSNEKSVFSTSPRLTEDNIRSKLNPNRELTKSGRDNHPASFRYEVLGDNCVPKTHVDKAGHFKVVKSPKQQISCESSYKSGRKEKTQERVEEDFESSVSDSLRAEERASLAGPRSLPRSRIHKGRSEKTQKRVEEDFESNVSDSPNAEERANLVSPQSLPRSRIHKGSTEKTQERFQEESDIESDWLGLLSSEERANLAGQRSLSRSRIPKDSREKSKERFQEEPYFESDVPGSLGAEERANEAGRRSLSQSKNNNSRNLESVSPIRKFQTDRVKSNLSMKNELNKSNDHSRNFYQYRASTSLPHEEPSTADVPETHVNKANNLGILKRQKRPSRSSKSKYQFDHMQKSFERVQEESMSESDLPESQLVRTEKNIHLMKNSRNSISSEREKQTAVGNIRSNLSKTTERNKSINHGSGHTFRHEELSVVNVPETLMNETSCCEVLKNQKQLSKSNEPRYQFNCRQTSQERVLEELDSEEVVSELKLESAKERTNLVQNSLSRSRNNDRNFKSSCYGTEIRTGGGNDKLNLSNRKKPNKSTDHSRQHRTSISFQQEELNDADEPEELISKARTSRRLQDKKVSNKSKYHRKTSEERFNKESDSESSISTSQRDGAEEIVNLARQKSFTESRSNRGESHHKSFSFMRKEKNSEIEKQTVRRENKSFHSNNLRSGKGQNQSKDNRHVTSEISKDVDQVLEDGVDLDDGHDEEPVSIHNDVHNTITVMGNYGSNFSSTKKACNFIDSENEPNKSRVSLTPSKKIVSQRHPNDSSSVKRLRRNDEQNYNDNVKVGLDGVYSWSEHFHPVSPHKKAVKRRGERNEVSMSEQQSKRANSNVEANSSKCRILASPSMQHPPIDSRTTQPLETNSEHLIQEVVGRNRNSEGLEESHLQIPGSMKRKRIASARKKQVEQEASNESDETDFQPNRRQLKFSSQRKDSRKHNGKSGRTAKNHLPGPKTKKHVQKTPSRDVESPPSPTSYLRERPQRSRIRPLKFWKGEHRIIQYRRDGNITVIETNLSNSPSLMTRVPQKKPKVTKRMVEDHVLSDQEQLVFFDETEEAEKELVTIYPIVTKQKVEDDVLSDQEQLMFFDKTEGAEKELVTIYPGLRWNDDTESGSYRIGLLNWSEERSQGYVEFDINGLKEVQYSPNLNLHFVVLKGIVQFTLYGRGNSELGSVKVGERNLMNVPCNVPYSIKNCYKEKSLLYFNTSLSADGFMNMVLTE